MRKVLLFLLPLIYLFTANQNILIKDNVFSPYAWATYYAVKRTIPVNIDGDLSEWVSVRGVTMDQEVFFFTGQGMSAAKWQGVNDLSGYFKLLWDSEFIYIAVEVIDDKVTEPHGSFVAGPESGSWDDDGIEIMFDNDSGNVALKQQLHWSGMNGIFWRNCQFFGTLILINQ